MGLEVGFQTGENISGCKGEMKFCALTYSCCGVGHLFQAVVMAEDGTSLPKAFHGGGNAAGTYWLPLPPSPPPPLCATPYLSLNFWQIRKLSFFTKQWFALYFDTAFLYNSMAMVKAIKTTALFRCYAASLCMQVCMQCKCIQIAVWMNQSCSMCSECS